jgi:hypothetical protein
MDLFTMDHFEFVSQGAQAEQRRTPEELAEAVLSRFISAQLTPALSSSETPSPDTLSKKNHAENIFSLIVRSRFRRTALPPDTHSRHQVEDRSTCYKR